MTSQANRRSRTLEHRTPLLRADVLQACRAYTQTSDLDGRTAQLLQFPLAPRRRRPWFGRGLLRGLVAAALLIVAGLIVLVPPMAFAAQTVELRNDAAIHDGRVTLGDLFDNAGPEANVLVADAGSGSSIVLDASRLQVFAGQHGLSWANDRGLRRVIARSGATSSAAAAVGARHASALVYARDISTGEIVGAEDLAWSRTAAFDPPATAPRDSRVLIGQVAKRPLRQGSPAMLADVSAPLVVKKDDVVAVTFQVGAVTLVLQAKAVTGAAAGGTFDAINPASHKIIQALATGPGEAVVGPQADRLKAALRFDPQLLASNP